MGLQITQTSTLLDTNRVNWSKLEIEYRHAKVELHQKHAKVNIESDLPKVQIDQHDAFASAGLKNNIEQIEQAAQRGRQQAMEYTAKKAQDGDRMANLKLKGNPISEIAARDAFPTHEFGLDFIPKVGPKFSVTGSLNIQAEPNGEGIHNGVETKVVPGGVNYNYTPSELKTYVKQYASIKFQYVEDHKIDTYV